MAHDAAKNDLGKTARKVVEEALQKHANPEDAELPNVKNLQQSTNRCREKLRRKHQTNPEFEITTQRNRDTVYLLSDGNHGNELLARLNTFFQQEKWTDIHLLTSDGTEVKAHKVILASCSPFFQDAINGLGNTNTIYLEDVSGSQVKDILGVIYTGLVHLSAANISAMEEIAERLSIVELTEVCKKYRAEAPQQPPAMDIDFASQDILSDALGQDPLNIKLEPVDPESDNNLVAVIQNTESLLPQSTRMNVITTLHDGAVKAEPLSPKDDDPNKSYPCTICGKAYPFFSCLQLHLRKHGQFPLRVGQLWRRIKQKQLNKGKRYKCPLCKQQNALKHRVLKHMLDCHFKSMKCCKCHGHFHSHVELQNHMYMKHNQGFRLSRNTLCLSCGRVFRHSKLANCHVPCRANNEEEFPGGTHASGSLKCNWCLQKFKHSKMLLRHLGFCSLRLIKSMIPTEAAHVASSPPDYSSSSVINIAPIEEMMSVPDFQDQHVDVTIRQLFERGILGSSCPKQLLDTVLFTVNHFLVPLRWIGWKNGSKLYHSQIEVSKEHDGRRCVCFYEGKVNGGQVFLEKNPRVKLFEKRNSPYCLVNYVAKYISLLPGVYSQSSPHGFFLTPKSTWSENSWYNQANLGVRSLGLTLKRIYRFLLPDHFVNEDWPRGPTCNYHLPPEVPESNSQGKNVSSQMGLLNICGYNVVRWRQFSNYNKKTFVVNVPMLIAPASVPSSEDVPASTSSAAHRNRVDPVPGPRCPPFPPIDNQINFKIETEEELRAIAAKCTQEVWETESNKTKNSAYVLVEPAAQPLQLVKDKTSTKRWQTNISHERVIKCEVPECVCVINEWLKSANKCKSKQQACDELGIKDSDTFTDLSSAQAFFLLNYLIHVNSSFLVDNQEGKLYKNSAVVCGLKSSKLDRIQAFYNENSKNPVDYLSDSDIKDLSCRKAVNIVQNCNLLSDCQLLSRGVLGSDEPKSLAKMVCYLLSSTFKMSAEALRDVKRIAVTIDKDNQGSYLCITKDNSSIFLHQQIHNTPITELESLVKQNEKTLLSSPSLKIYSNSHQPNLCIVNILTKYLCKSNSWEKTLILKPAKFWNNNTWYQQSIMGVGGINSLLYEIAAAKLGCQYKGCQYKGSLSSLQYAHMLETNLNGLTVEECQKCAMFLSKN